MTWRWALPLVFACAALTAQASMLLRASDLIDSSVPSGVAHHTVTFTATHAIPASGSIAIVPQGGAFDIPAGFGFSDVEFAVWNGSSYIDQPLAATADATNSGVSVTPGNAGSVSIVLPSSSGLPAGSKIEVRLGLGAQNSTTTPAILNPSTVGSWRIDIATYDALNGLIDSASAMVATVAPVGLDVLALNTAPVRSNGLPTSTIEAGNSVVELSLNTDRNATCKWSTTPGVQYDSMTNTFTTYDHTTHTTIMSGLADNTSYTYYVRCISEQLAFNIDDYVISFSLGPTPISNTSVTQSGGTIGQGPYTNGSSVLYQASLKIAGFSSPLASIVLLKDGVRAASAQTDGSGYFSAILPNLERGLYTFAVYANDSSGVKSASYTASVNIVGGTSNTLSGFLLPPTLSLASSSVAAGGSVRVFGQSVPSSSVVVSIRDASGLGSAQTFNADASLAGDWQLTIPAGALARGSYVISAHATLGTAQTNESTPLNVGVGQAAASGGTPAGSDLNGDSKVNLVDFSILLTAWGTSNPAGDLNHDGTVNLADFSILLFNWTG